GSLYHPLNGWMYAVYAAAISVGCLRKDALNRPARFVALLALGYCLIVSQKQLPYVSVLEPCLALSLAAWLLGSSSLPWKTVAFNLGALMLVYPLGKIPALLILSLAVLPKKYFQWATLILLVSLLMQPYDLRVWLTHAGEDFRTLWWLSGAGMILIL